MLFLAMIVALFVQTIAVAQNAWLYAYPGQQPYSQPQMPASGFAPLFSNHLAEGQQYNSYLNYGIAQSQPPRMQLIQVNLMCETVPSQQPQIIRWVRQDSVSIASTPLPVAEAQNSADPQRYAVELQQLPNGVTRSILTLLRPEPDTTQAAYFCQSSTAGAFAQSREVYVMGNRQFVNANMAYYAADIFPHNSGRSGDARLAEAIQMVTPDPQFINDTSRVIYHEHEKRKWPPVGPNITLPLTAN